MKHVYFNSTNIFRASILCASLAIASLASAQNSTGSFQSTNCDVIRENFDLGNGGYTSPSLYGDQRRDSSFYYNIKRGFWTELGEDARERINPPRPAASRLVSILSTSYPSPTTEGAFDVGFVYVVPNPGVDRFIVSLVRLVTTPAPGGFDETTASTVAVSGFKTFTEFSSIAPVAYNDPFGNPGLTGQRGAICMRIVDADITVGSNTRYRVDVTYEIATPATFTVFDDLSLNNVTESSPLPVDFIGMLVKRNNKTAEIRWDISNEVNVKEYQVEKSDDGRSFHKIASLNATNSSLYSYTDGAAGTGTVLYRIKSIDIDTKSKYSSVVRLKGLSSYSNILKLYPLPAKNEVTVEHKNLASNAKITLSTADGRVIKVVAPSNGASHTLLDLRGLVSGMYIVRLDDGNSNVESVKLIKQ
jgi:hypothetical protein